MPDNQLQCFLVASATRNPIPQDILHQQVCNTIPEAFGNAFGESVPDATGNNESAIDMGGKKSFGVIQKEWILWQW